MTNVSRYAVEVIVIGCIFVMGFYLFGTATPDSCGAQILFGTTTVHGICMKTRSGHEVYAFLGIPYAQPPVGSLRFKVSFFLKRIKLHIMLIYFFLKKIS